MATDQLPALPEPETLSRGDEDGAIQLGYTADQMRAYALAAIAAARARAVPVELERNVQPSINLSVQMPKIELQDPELDATDPHTRLLLLAEYWKREAMRHKDLADTQREELLRTWHVLHTFGAHPGRTDDRLADCVRNALMARPPAPEQPADLSGQAATAAGERTPVDYALEHAEYMAAAAERFVTACDREAEARQAIDDNYDEGRDAALADALDEALEHSSESRSSLRTRVYEFRKRRDRASLSTPASTFPQPTPKEQS